MTQDVTPSESGERFRQTRLFCSSSLQFLVADRDAACQGVSKVFKPHELKPVQRGEVVSASLHHISRGRLSLNRLEYGTDVDIDPQCLQDFYLVQIPLTGGADIHCGAVDFQSSPQVAALLSPELPVVSQPGPAWQGLSGYIPEHFDRRFLTDQACDLYLCGPPPMVEAVKTWLDQQGLGEETRLYSEKFLQSASTR